MTARTNGSKILTVASGKGGVGKTNITANLAITLSNRGERVLVFDADMGLANMDVLLGLTPRFSMRHVLNASRSLDEILIPGPCGITIVPASSGFAEMANLSMQSYTTLVQALQRLASRYDRVLIDAPAGIGTNAIRFSTFADELVVVTTPEPTSITDAYALVKVALREKPGLPIHLIVNMAETSSEARRVAEAFSEITTRFLGSSVTSAGGLPYDHSIPQAVRCQQPFVTMYPDSCASNAVRCISHRLNRDAGATVRSNAPVVEATNRITSWLDA